MTGPLPAVRIVGAGLVGTSIGLAVARAGWRVVFEDSAPGRSAAAQQAVAALATASSASQVGESGRPGDPASPLGAAGREREAFRDPDVVVVAVPPAGTGQKLLEMSSRYVDATVMDVASVKLTPTVEVEAAKPQRVNIVLSHPLGGRATTGPAGAVPDLFAGRTWVLCRASATADHHAARAEALVRTCLAVPRWLAPEIHDRVVATTSHLPQLVASSLAAAIADVGPAAFGMSGPAVTEMTRVADSPSEMWAQIVGRNRAPIVEGIDALVARLTGIREALQGGDGTRIELAVDRLLADGRAGRAVLAAKHAGSQAPDVTDVDNQPWEWVEVALADEPGALAQILLAAADRHVNVEDVRFDHAPYRDVGTVGLAVRSEQAEALRAALAELDDRWGFLPAPDPGAD